MNISLLVPITSFNKQLFVRVRCQRQGGVRFQVNGNPYFELVSISNVGGSGVICAVWIKGSKTDWMLMTRNWGMNWQSGAYLNGQTLSFRLQTDDGKTLTFYNVAPSNWYFGSTYTPKLNFQFYNGQEEEKKSIGSYAYALVKTVDLCLHKHSAQNSVILHNVHGNPSSGGCN